MHDEQYQRNKRLNSKRTGIGYEEYGEQRTQFLSAHCCRYRTTDTRLSGGKMKHVVQLLGSLTR